LDYRRRFRRFKHDRLSRLAFLKILTEIGDFSILAAFQGGFSFFSAGSFSCWTSSGCLKNDWVIF